MRRPQIFLSYRRDDSAGFARAIGDALGRRFGADRVFVDVDDIGAGQSFDRAIDDAVQGARVLLVLIGPRWLAVPEGATRPRLHEPGDFVRHEVATGLARGLQVIPLLLDGATMPAEADLPEPLRPLARRQALSIDNARFAADLERLVLALRSLLGEAGGAAAAGVDAGAAAAPWSPPRHRRPRPAAGLAALAVASIVIAWGAWAWHTRAPSHDGATTAARPPLNGRWTAELLYPWANARYTEQFVLAGEGTALHGTASFLRVDRAIVDGRVDADGRLEFSTRSQELAGSGDTTRELTHRYRGRRVGDELRLVLQTEGGSSPGTPVEFTARRATP